MDSSDFVIDKILFIPTRCFEQEIFFNEIQIYRNWRVS